MFDLTSTDEVQTMNSREIAELVESQHTHVKISMERLREKGLITFVATREKGLGRPTELHEMYLDNKLPMRKVWDGKFTHDVL